MRCDEIMKRGVRTLRPADPVQRAAELMRDLGIGFLPVCDEDGRVLGTLTDRDITIRVTADARDPTIVEAAEAMTREVIACRPEDDIERARGLMMQHRKSRLLITDERGRLAGVLSLADIARRFVGDTVLSNFGPQRLPGDPEVTRGEGLVAPGRAERGLDRRPLGFIERQDTGTRSRTAGKRRLHARRHRNPDLGLGAQAVQGSIAAPDLGRQMLGEDDRRPAEEHRAFEHVPELAHVPAPRVALEELAGRR